MTTIRISLGVCVALLCTACGADEGAGTGPTGVLTGLPTWRVLPDGLGETDKGLVLRARSPTRMRFRIEATDRLPRTTPWRDVAAGQTLRIFWQAHELPPESVPQRPSPTDVAAGRTEVHVVLLSVQFDDGMTVRERYAQSTRPGRSQIPQDHLLPPGTYEEMPAVPEINLATIAMLDLAAGEGRLRRRSGRPELILPEPSHAADQATVIRLTLEIDPQGGDSR